MGKYDKEYEAFQIFEQIQETEERIAPPLTQKKAEEASANADPYYEIEYDSCPMPGVGKFVLKPGKIEAPEKDEVRVLFDQMREIARENRNLYFGSSRFYDKRTRQENAKIFYKQGMFMKDFEDDYEKYAPYSSYFPNYQMMGYEQLRTYFTWRTQVRQGKIAQTSLSYAFLYIYELINNIGVDNPQDGLDKLLSFWDAYRVCDQSIDKYVLKWLKDYHIYYELSQSFREFIDQNNLGTYYPRISDPEDNFALLCAISKYDIRESSFYTDETKDLIKNCFLFLVDKLREAFLESRIVLDEFIFQPTKNMSVWTPFQDALFYPVLRQPDRRVILSEKEIYICAQNRWSCNTVITTESGRRLVAYCLKQMEAVLRRMTKFKYKLSASIKILSPVMADELHKAGISLETIVTDAVMEFYKEATKVVVKVDGGALEKIRQEALATQEKLIVPEQEEFQPTVSVCRTDSMQNAVAATKEAAVVTMEEAALAAMEDVPFISQQNEEADSLTEPWKCFRNALTETEMQALLLIGDGGTGLKQFADEHGVMLEVLIDGINEKAMDFVGDSLLDDEFRIYDDYTEQVKGMVESI